MSERTLLRLQHQRKYCSLLDALHTVCGSSPPGDPSMSDPLNVYPGARALLEEHKSERGDIQLSPKDALDCLLKAAIVRFGYSARDVFGAVFNYTSITQRHEESFTIQNADLYYTVVSALSGGHDDSMVPHRILALSPVDQGPLVSVRWEVDFKSIWVAKGVTLKLGEAEDHEIRRQVRMLRSIPEAGALAGWMLEPLAHRHITNGTTNILLFNMKSNNADPPHFTLVRDPPVPNNQQFIKVKRKIVRLGSIDDLSSCLENRSYYVPDDPNFPLFDAFTIDVDRAKKSAILWVLQMTTSRKHKDSAKGYQKIREIMMILKEFREPEEPPLKKSKATAEDLAVQVRYLLVVPQDEPWSQSRNLQWDFPKGWNETYTRNDHRGPVYCMEVPLSV